VIERVATLLTSRSHICRTSDNRTGRHSHGLEDMTRNALGSSERASSTAKSEKNSRVVNAIV